MSGDESDIAVGAGAEFRVIVTRLGVCRSGAGGCSGSCRVGGTTTAGGSVGDAIGALKEGNLGGGGGARGGVAAG